MFEQQMQQTGPALSGSINVGSASAVAPAPTVTVVDVVQRHDSQLIDLQKGLVDAHEQIRFLRARLGI